MLLWYDAVLSALLVSPLQMWSDHRIASGVLHLCRHHLSHDASLTTHRLFIRSWILATSNFLVRLQPSRRSEYLDMFDRWLIVIKLKQYQDAAGISDIDSDICCRRGYKSTGDQNRTLQSLAMGLQTPDIFRASSASVKSTHRPQHTRAPSAGKIWDQYHGGSSPSQGNRTVCRV